jgi:hypothetical protein
LLPASEFFNGIFSTATEVPHAPSATTATIAWREMCRLIVLDDPAKRDAKLLARRYAAMARYLRRQLDEQLARLGREEQGTLFE